MGRLDEFRKSAATAWTAEQTAIFEALGALPPGGALAVEALAGTGKTTTLVEALVRLRRSKPSMTALLLAFGAKNAQELDAKTPDTVKGSTFHALARRACGKDPNYKKIWVQAKALGLPYHLHGPAKELASLAKNLGFGLPGAPAGTVEDFVALLEPYGIRFKRRYSAAEVAKAGRDLFQVSFREESMDFDDMLYALARDGFPESFQVPGIVPVDEAQDLNYAQILILDALRARDPDVRLVFVGDPNQSIYTWRGAAHDAFGELVRRYSAPTLPLTICWRCDEAILESARVLVPHIRARPGAGAGVVRQVFDVEVPLDQVEDGDAVICRSNAGLFGFVKAALAAGRRLRVLGKGLDKVVMTTVRAAYPATGPRAVSGVAGINSAAAFSAARSAAREDLKERPMALAKALDDLIMAEVVWGIARSRAKAPWGDRAGMERDLETLVATLFVDEEAAPSGGVRGPEAITVSTIHRSKGLEWDRVWFYRPTPLPSAAAVAQGGDVLLEEEHLDYVGRTRARKELIFVSPHKVH